MVSRLEITEEDVHELRTTFESRGWEIIAEVVDSWIENNTQAMMTEESHAGMLRRQGSARTLERIKGLASELLDRRASEKEALAQIRSEEKPHG